ncbi:MAG TPA: helix-turn-helix domain-containing protein [Thermoanaerobaculia bacterium]
MDRMIGEKIRELRQAQGRSLADVAGRAKISVATLSRIENDKQSLDLGLFLVLAKLLHVAPQELLDGGDDRDENPDPLARRIAALATRERTELWREVAAERRALRGRSAHSDTTQQVEEMLAQIDFLREELDRMRKHIRKR